MDDEDIRLFLQSALETAFPGLTVYYRPTGNIAKTRPCVVYEPRKTIPSYSNNAPFVVGREFQVSILSDVPGYNTRPMFSIPGITNRSNNSFISEDIVHDVFIVAVNTIKPR
jgi:hypothetical protein